MKFYYGFWNNFYDLKWSIRYFFEIVILLIVLSILFKILRKICEGLHLKEKLIKVWVWIISELVYLVGQNKEWAIKEDEKIKDWGSRKLDENRTKGHALRNLLCVLLITLVYFGGIFVDLPISQRLEASYREDFVDFKYNVQGLERFLSKGYENYPPLFIKETKASPKDDNKATEEEVIYIRLNEEGKNGTNLRQEPSLDGVVVGGINGEVILIYQNQWQNDGERYWLKVYCADEDIYGWISGKLVEQEQLESIIESME